MRTVIGLTKASRVNCTQTDSRQRETTVVPSQENHDKTRDIEKKIEAAEMWFIRRMLRISWAEKKTNVNVLREGNVQRSLLKTIRKRQMEFLGHVCRRRGLEFLSLTGKVEGKRDRGKQRITFLDSLCNSATGGQSKGLNFLKLSDDRDVWRGMVANVCSRSGT